MGTPGHDAQKAFLYSGEHGTALGRREAVLSRDGKETASCLEKVSYAVLQGRRFRVGLFGIRPGKGEAEGTGDECWQYLLPLRGEQDEERGRGGLFEGLQKGVGGFGAGCLYAGENNHPEARIVRGIADDGLEPAHVVHAEGADFPGIFFVFFIGNAAVQGDEIEIFEGRYLAAGGTGEAGGAGLPGGRAGAAAGPVESRVRARGFRTALEEQHLRGCCSEAVQAFPDRLESRA